MSAALPGCRIITFYSYKGGTGRSMALANVAWILAAKGKKVLVIDWDLEAPGVHRYFQPFLVDKELVGTEGLIDFVIELSLKALTPSDRGEDPSQQWYLKHADLTRYAISLAHKFPGRGRLDFIPAGRQDSSYSRRVNSFDWQAFYNRLGGGALLEEARRRIRQEYDYALIDSRTGVSDTSGISTVQMPDSLVVCYTLNNQGIEGASAITESVVNQRGSAARPGSTSELPLRIFPVAMRVDPFEKEKLTARRHYAEAKFSAFPNHLAPEDRTAYRAEVEFPYVPYYAYEEVLAPFADQSRELGSLLACSERLVKYLSDGDVPQLAALPTERERAEVLAQYARRPAAREKLDLLVVCQSSDKELAWRLVVAPLEAETWKGRKLCLAFHPKDDRPWNAWAESVRADLLKSRKVAVVMSAHSDSIDFAETFVERELGGSRVPGTSSDPLIILDFRGKQAKRTFKFTANRIQVEDENRFASEDIERLLSFVKNEPWLGQAPQPSAPPPSAESVTISLPTAPQEPRDLIRDARARLRGKTTKAEELLRLARQLKGVKQFGLARRLLELAKQDPGLMGKAELSRTLGQQLALCTYKDPDLPAGARLDKAWAILRGVDDLSTTRDQETLGLAGAIHKRFWEIDGRTRHLETAREFYLRGYQQGVASDYGYTAINAAFVLDLLAALEGAGTSRPGALLDLAQSRLDQAISIRRDILSTLVPLIEQFPDKKLDQQWWFLVTVAEAHFGVGDYSAALPWLKKAAALPGTQVWEFETTARQLATLLRLHQQFAETASPPGGGTEEARRVLEEFLGRSSAGVDSALRGKVGLALSGGGFRASLFHIGVLARLAELDLLRHVEVLSCVSGGSIIGAHYYLEVRHLLQSMADEQISRDDYVAIVQRIAHEFLAGVQTNLRTRVAASFRSNLRMLFDRHFSRTERLGGLFESELFARVNDGEGSMRRWLTDLYIRPKGESKDFAPKHENWRRRAKVPILVLNATTLNTGHNWQFTASWMGEPPANLESEVSGRERLRRMYYHEAPPHFQRIRLGHAVAASACVPGLFEPLELAGLYPERDVRLVDGGVYDNQGVASLLEQDCSVLCVSDAGGQMRSESAPSASPVAVGLRTISVLQARVREAEFRELESRRRGSLLRDLLFLHLKKDLPAGLVNWTGCEESVETSPPPPPLTPYGIAPEIQQRLADLRTDLDAFSEAEAFALMTSGYRMAEMELRTSMTQFQQSDQPTYPWPFLAVEQAMRGDPAAKPSNRRLQRLLKIGQQQLFKPFLSAQWTSGIILGFCSLVAAGVGLAAWQGWLWLAALTDPYLLLKWLGLGIVGGLGVTFFGSIASLMWQGTRFGEALQRSSFGLVLSTQFWMASRLYLVLLNRVFLRAGKLRNLLDTTGPVSPGTKRRVYLCSTFTDLRAHRSQVIEALQHSFDILPRDSNSTRETGLSDGMLRDIEACEAFVGIVAWRRGHVPEANNPTRKSVVELAYDRARELEKPCFMFLLDEKTPWLPTLIDVGEQGAQLKQFRKRIAEETTVEYFTTADELARQVSASLLAWSRQVDATDKTGKAALGSRHAARQA